MTTLYLDQGDITDADVAAIFTANGTPCAVGDAEFRLLDHPDNPGYSIDFPSEIEARAFAAAHGHTVVDIRKED